MKVLFIIVVVIFCLLSIVSCISENKNKYEVAGLTEEIYIKLCGTWYFEKDILDRTPSWSEKFSWGRGIGFTDGVTAVDLGNKSKRKPPYEPPMIVVAGGNIQKVLSVEVLQNNIYKINVHGTFYDGIISRERDGYYLFHFVDEEAFWIERDIPLKSDFTGPKYIWYRISGPKKPNR
jgi:hypothetical protein